MKLPPLRSVHYFESVARNLSFSKAADELNVTQSAISHQIRLLEDYLGEPLFLRQGRKLSLTETGEQYLEEVNPAIASIAKASQRIREGEQGTIRLALYSSLAVKWLIPRLSEFKRLYPEIELTLNMVAEDPDLSDATGDCFITVEQPARNYVAEPLYNEVLYPVCSQKIWKEIHDQPFPDALWNYPILSTDSVLHERGKDWHKWCEAGGFELPHGLDMQHFSHMLLAVEAAKYDQGIAFANGYMMTDKDLQDLVVVPSHGLDTGDHFYFVYKKSRARQVEIKKLANWLQQQC
ncbi:LysR family transcriptional regulator [Vibrio sp. E150_011]|uniref:LysR family transcriptional regulator n=1 Tax=Vibrio sp. 10N.261.51.F12 TaxID=3229679 RepID=UPI003553ACDB